MVSCPIPEKSKEGALPEEFTLQLGPHSATQIAMMARLLREMGADVHIDAHGNLTALRPS